MSERFNDKLVEIPPLKWRTLRDMYLRDWPTHMVGYYTMDNYIRWKSIKSDIKLLHVYSLNGDWQQDGLFIVVDRYQVLLNSIKFNNDSIERLTRALVLLNWTHGLQVNSFMARHRPAVLQALNSLHLTTAYDDKTVLYYMPRADAAALHVTCPDAITLRPMSQEHAIIADAVWPYRHQGSLFILKRWINWNTNIGVFTDNGKLIAWCFRTQAGALGTIQVDSNYKKRGFGTLVTKNIAKHLSNFGMDSYATVKFNNDASRRMFDKIGFKIIDNCYYLRTKPLIVSDWNDIDSN